MAQRMIDAFPHIWPAPFFERLKQAVPNFVARANFRDRTSLYDLDERFRIMDHFENYVQVLTLGPPTLEEWPASMRSIDSAKLANESMAELVQRYPDRFVGFAASMMLEDVDASLKEAERAIFELGALGVQMFTNVNGHPMDEARFEPLYDTLERWNKPIWVHPMRPPSTPDYPSEEISKYGLYMKFGWPYETTIFMSRLIYSGVMDRHPNLRVLTHHAGGVLPHLAGRLTLQQETPEMLRELGIDESFTEAKVLASYRRFYGDTVFSGAHQPLECALDFFGTDHILFGTDFPFGVEAGEMFIRETIAAVQEAVSDAALSQQLFEDNAHSILGVP